MNIPIFLTFIRIGLIPIFALAYYLPVSWANIATTAVFVLAGITDWFDGYLARRLNQTSAFGAFLDPVADKLMVAVALILLMQTHPNAWMADPRRHHHRAGNRGFRLAGVDGGTGQTRPCSGFLSG